MGDQCMDWMGGGAFHVRSERVCTSKFDYALLLSLSSFSPCPSTLSSWFLFFCFFCPARSPPPPPPPPLGSLPQGTIASLPHFSPSSFRPPFLIPLPPSTRTILFYPVSLFALLDLCSRLSPPWDTAHGRFFSCCTSIFLLTHPLTAPFVPPNPKLPHRASSSRFGIRPRRYSFSAFASSRFCFFPSLPGSLPPLPLTCVTSRPVPPRQQPNLCLSSSFMRTYPILSQTTPSPQF